MSGTQLNENLQSDINTIKHMRLDILPAKKYYKEMLKIWGIVYLLLISALFLSCLVAKSIDAWPYTPRYERKMNELQKYGLPKPIRWTIADAVWQRDKDKIMAERVNELKKEEERNHGLIVVKMILGVFGSSLFIMFFLTGYIKMYVIFENQMIAQLKTGDYIKKKVWLAFAVFFGFFTVFSLFTVSVFEQDLTFFAGAMSFIFSGIISSFLIDMEFSRIGISALTNTIADYFGGEKDLLQKTNN